ncbi:hypothetical protein, partial [Streptomyces olivaceus]|uniref:hypothetical protein n=1 Tax=Streptomyces olivaceus TaxID=47716 RepID=UPI0036639523
MTTPHVPADRLLPLTGAQWGIWNAQRLEPDSPYYLVGDVVEISGPEPVEAPGGGPAGPPPPHEAENQRHRGDHNPHGPPHEENPGA